MWSPKKKKVVTSSPGPTTLIGATVTVKLLSGSGWSME